MSLTRGLLKGMGLTEEQVSAVIEEHVNVVNALKDEIKTYKTDAEKLPSVQKELEDLKKSGGDWQKKYESEHTAFENYKKDAAEKELLKSVKSAYKALLKDQKIGDKHIDSILKVTDLSKIKLDKDGNLEDKENLVKTIKTEWDGFIVTESEKGASVPNPPASGSVDYDKMSDADYYKATYDKKKG